MSCDCIDWEVVIRKSLARGHLWKSGFAGFAVVTRNFKRDYKMRSPDFRCVMCHLSFGSFELSSAPRREDRAVDLVDFADRRPFKTAISRTKRRGLLGPTELFDGYGALLEFGLS
jgi:hypothetical protein